MLRGLSTTARRAAVAASAVPARAVSTAAPTTARRVATLQASGDLSGCVLVDVQPERGIATLTLNRPKAFNALNRDVVRDLRLVFKAASFDDEVGGSRITALKAERTAHTIPSRPYS
jgi:hypothetical protein